MDAKMLKGKVAIITGASYGMGQTMAKFYACLYLASKMGKAVRGQVLQVCNGAFL